MISTATLPLTWSRKLLCLCGVVAFVAAAYFAPTLMLPQSTDASLEQTLQAVDAHSPGWRLADLVAAREPVPDDENSALDVERAAQLLPADWYGATRQFIFRHSRKPDAFDPDEKLAVQTELQQRDAALAVAAPLADKPRGRHALVLTDKPWTMPLVHATHTAQVVQILTLDALARADAGDLTGAARSCRAALNAARSLGDDPFVHVQLMRREQAGVAVRGIQHLLNHGVSDPETLADLQRRLEAEAEHPGFTVALRGHRALVHVVLQAVEAGQLPWNQLIPEKHDSLLNWYSEPSLDEVCHEHATLLLFCGRSIDVTSQPAPRRAELLRNLQSEVDGAFPRLGVLVRYLPVLEQRFTAYEAQLRCVAAALAAERFRCSHGRWPKTLDELAPAFLKEMPLDPADGEPLGYEHTDDGVVIASRCLDDRGRVYRSDAPTARGGVGVRLWDVSQRGRSKPPVLLPAVEENKVDPPQRRER